MIHDVTYIISSSIPTDPKCHGTIGNGAVSHPAGDAVVKTAQESLMAVKGWEPEMH